MRSIVLLGITICGFKSFSEQQIVRISQTPGLKFVAGDNRAELELGANGAGKSTFFSDALCWNIYGTSTRGRRTADLVSHGQTGATVMTYWEIDQAVYSIKRSGPPNRTCINNEPCDQEAIERLLGLSKQQFLQSVLFAQGVPLFYALSVPKRGELFDEILNLQFWLERSEVAAERGRQLDVQAVDLEKQLERLRGRLEGLAAPSEEQAEEWEREQQNKLQETRKRQRFAMEQVKIYQAKRDELQQDCDKSPVIDTMPVMQQIGSLRERIGGLSCGMTDIESKLKFLNESQSCPTCEQTISREHANAERRRLSTRANQHQAELDAVGRALQTAVAKLNVLQAENQRREVLARELEATSQLLQASQEHARQATELAEQAAHAQPVNPFRERIEEIALERQHILARHEEQTSALAAIRGKQLTMQYWQAGFKRVRAFAAGRVLAYLNVEIDRALVSLGLPGWTVRLENEAETKSGTLKHGIYVEVRDPHGRVEGERSPGEEARVQWAVALGLGDAIQRLAGVEYNFRVFDEPTNWLSDRGIESLLEALKRYADIAKKSIFLIDHRALTYFGFDEVLEVVKTDRGSRILQR